MDKIMKYVYFTVFTFLIAIVIDTTGVQAYTPLIGGVQCDYPLQYIDTDGSTISTMNLTYKIKYGAIETTGGEWTCDSESANSPCERRKIIGDIVYTNNLTSPANFYNSKNNDWQCPAISYSMKYSNNTWNISVGLENEFGEENSNQIGQSRYLIGKISNKISPNNEEDTNFGNEIDKDCQDILGSTLDIIQTIFNWIKYIAPVLLVVFGTIDYAKVVITDDKEGIKKATSNFIKRAIAAAAIFFLPLIINVILSLPEIETGLNDVVCGISKVVIK